MESETADRKPSGTIAWFDLTVPDTEQVRDFYAAVVGWGASPLAMDGGYHDYVMTPAASGEGVAGICHARGVNAGLPPYWLPYILVEVLDASLAKCAELGGSLVAGPHGPAGGRYGVIRDPAGAYAALIEQS